MKYTVLQVEHIVSATAAANADIPPIMNGNAFSLDTDRLVVERYPAEPLVKGLCEICIPVKQISNFRASSKPCFYDFDDVAFSVSSI
jgi:hypothetical protein